MIYAGTRGYLDTVAVKDVGRYESELLGRLHSQHADLLTAIRTQKSLTDELEAQLKSILDSFTSTFA